MPSASIIGAGTRRAPALPVSPPPMTRSPTGSTTSVSHRTILAIAVPIMLSNVSTPLLGAVDTAVVGQIPDPAHIGAVAVGSLVFTFVFWAFGFLRMGTTGLTAQALGARDSDEMVAALGRALKTVCVTNLWIPDGFKDTPADRAAHRERLCDSLDAVFRDPLSARHHRDAVEPKLFGIGAESCTVGSHEFYLGYAITRRILLCLDAGHFHPTESVADKISAVLQFVPELLLHVSRGVRWDSDHVVTLTDELLLLAREVIAPGLLPRVRFGLDYFDASIHRVAAWVIGTRALQRALLIALLEPPGIREAERRGDRTARLALQEEAKGLPAGAIWDHFCEAHSVPVGDRWLEEIRRYEREVSMNRGAEARVLAG
ncbi:MAG: L-rhamnose isomerase [Verrucomicrobia bacterium]|nr:L-rhamnose isomerase [Verrucomicrobiota bacterium]